MQHVQHVDNNTKIISLSAKLKDLEATLICDIKRKSAIPHRLVSVTSLHDQSKWGYGTCGYVERLNKNGRLLT